MLISSDIELVILIIMFKLLGDKGLIINFGEATKWENRRSETFCAPPPLPKTWQYGPPPSL